MAAYRDAGEMTSLLSTLGVAHPPGYPLYTLLGHLFVQIPLGNMAYRANIFSGFCGAAALALFFLLIRKYLPSVPALLAAATLGLSHPFWELSVVSEMYSLGALMVLALLLSLEKWDQNYIWPFLLGLSLSVRMDLLLLVPVVVGWCWFQKKPYRWGTALFVFLLGLSVFLYLPIRSAFNPVLDWGNPESLGALFASLSRKSYGGTLDLISTAYKKGENFPINIFLYLKHLWTNFGLISLLAGLGIGWTFVRRWSFGVLLTVSFLITGPVFLFLANMPPNPHSLAIIEASYLAPDLFVAVLAGYGLSQIWPKSRLVRPLLFAGLLGFLFINFTFAHNRNSKRDSWMARDYVLNTNRSLPPNAIGIFHDDVQLFSLWHTQLVDHKRLDVGLISTGLSGSPWYWDMKRRWKTAISPVSNLKSAEGWTELMRAAKGRPIYFGTDVDVPQITNVRFTGSGFLGKLEDGAAPPSGLSIEVYRALFLFRTRGRVGHTADFFSSDLLTDQSRALHLTGVNRLLGGDPASSVPFLTWSAALDPTFARPMSDLGYYFYSTNQWNEARGAYQEALRRSDYQLEQARQFKALPDVVASLRREASDGFVSLGGIEEKLGQKESARERYEKALSYYPQNSQAHYNLAVVEWGQNWPKVISHLNAAIQANPQNSEARKYLAVAHQKLGRQ